MEIYDLWLALGLVALNGFFVAAEFAIVKIRPSRINELARQKRFGAAALRRCVDKLDSHLSATQIGVTLSSIALGWIAITSGGTALWQTLERHLGIGHYLSFWPATLLVFIFVSFVHIVVGELVPKSLALLRTEAVALTVALPLRAVYLVFYPAIVVLGWMSSGLVALLGLNRVTGRSEAQNVSEDEITTVLNQAHNVGLLSAERAELLRKALTLSTKSARHLMVPRNEVTCLDINLSLQENLSRAMESEHTRFPLCNRELDEVIGVVDVRDALHRQNERQTKGEGDIDLREIAVAAAYFPEVMAGDRLLAEFRARRIAMAIVVDEYGGASGIVTPADVVTAVMGELEDEDEEEVVALPGGAFDVEGSTPLEEVEEALDVRIAVEDTTTVAGLLMERLGRMPRPGDRIESTGLVFKVVDVSGPKVGKVRIVRESARSG